MYLANFKLSEFALKWFVNESFNDINDGLKKPPLTHCRKLTKTYYASNLNL